MKLVQLNAWLGRLRLNIESFLEAERPDFVCLQEVFSCDDDLTVIFDNFNFLQLLQKRLGFPYVFFAPTWSFDLLDKRVEMGNAILSKFPCEQQQILFTNGEYHHRSRPEDATGNTRNAQIAKITPDKGEPFWLINHHGYHELTPLGSEATVEKLQVLIKEIRKLEGPIVFAGDLNVNSQSKAMRLFDGWLEDLTAKHHVTSTLTQLGKVSGVACDHILINDAIQEISFLVHDTLVSDHTPLVFEFDT